MGHSGTTNTQRPTLKNCFSIPRARGHRHTSIARSGTTLLTVSAEMCSCNLSTAGPDDSWSEEEFTVQVHGKTVQAKPGFIVRLCPGQSLCIPPRTIHQFWGEEGKGVTISSEISSLCDDQTDNYFMTPSVRFPRVEEDEPRQFYLCHESRQVLDPVGHEEPEMYLRGQLAGRRNAEASQTKKVP